MSLPPTSEDPVFADPPVSPSTDWLLRQLTRSIAHNLNNRLTGIVGCLEGTLQEAGRESPLASRLQLGLTCALQAAEMVRRMVMFSYRPSGMPGASLADLGAVAENAAQRIREHNRPGLHVEVQHASAHPARANAVLVQLALDQLADN